MSSHRQGNASLDTDLDEDLNVTTDRQATNTARAAETTQTRVPVIEEELQVGKREVEKGGVRVTADVKETPVQEQVRLREEHVTVDRRPVDRPATEADLRAAQGSALEVTETAEEAVVAKQARVVEEVIIGKEATERTQTVQDTVRRTEVNVEQLDRDYRANYQSAYGSRGGSYDQYQPAYRFGSQLASDQRYANSDWNDVEADARKSWAAQNSGNWDDFKDAVRYGWDRVRDRR